MTAAAPPLAPDIAAGLRRLKLAAIRQLAPEPLITARTQRWAPEELLRTMIEAEITARDASNAATRMKSAAFPRPGHRQPLALRIVGPVPARAHHRRQPAGPAAPSRECRDHRGQFLPHAPSPYQRRNHPEQDLINPRGGDF